MIPRLGQALQQIHAPSLAGDGLPERLRSVTVGMVGLVAATGLGLVAITLNQGLPAVGGSAIPESPSEHVTDARALTRPAPSGAARPALLHRAPGSGAPARAATGDAGSTGPQTPSSQTHHQPGGVAPGVSSPDATAPTGHGGAGAPAAGPPAGAGAPATAPAPPVATPPAQTPAPSPPVAAPSTTSSGPGNGKGKAKGHEKASHVEAPPVEQVVTAPEPPGSPEEGGDSQPGNGKGHAFGHEK